MNNQVKTKTLPGSIVIPGGRTGVLLIHSLGGTPVELRYVAQSLARLGYTVHCPLLPGLGANTDISGLSRWQDWYKGVRQAHDTLLKSCDTVMVGGLSAGAMLTVPVAVRRMIDLGFSGEAPDLVNKYFITLVGIGLVLALASAARFYAVNWLGERVVADIRRDVFAHLTGLSPAFSAGLSLVTSTITAPLASLSLKVAAASLLTGRIWTPSQPRTTFPFSRSCGRISLAMLIGTANPTPEDCWVPPVMIMVLMPITSPLVFSSGPPELPGLIEASVWIISTWVPWMVPRFSGRPL